MGRQAYLARVCLVSEHLLRVPLCYQSNISLDRKSYLVSQCLGEVTGLCFASA